MMKNAYLPKISTLLQFGGEILALLCPGDSIQILLILSQFQTLRVNVGKNRGKSKKCGHGQKIDFAHTLTV